MQPTVLSLSHTCEHDEGRSAFATQTHVVGHERRGMQLRRRRVAQRSRTERGRCLCGVTCAARSVNLLQT